MPGPRGTAGHGDQTAAGTAQGMRRDGGDARRRPAPDMQADAEDDSQTGRGEEGQRGDSGPDR
jgi:hypothetical protein